MITLKETHKTYIMETAKCYQVCYAPLLKKVEERMAEYDERDVYDLDNLVKNITAKVVQDLGDRLYSERVSVAITQLITALDTAGFTGTSEDKKLLELVENHVIREYPVSEDEIKNLNHVVKDYLIGLGKTTYSDFISYLLGSKTLRTRGASCPIEVLKKKAREEAEEYERLCSE